MYTVAIIQQCEIVTLFRRDTISECLRAIVGQRNFLVIRDHVKQVLTVSDDEIRAAMTLVWQTLRLVIEPSSATVIAAIAKHPELFGGHKIGAIISGGNIHPADWCALTGAAADAD